MEFIDSNYYGIYFYLIGSLLFYFNMVKTNNLSIHNAVLLLLLFSVVSYFLTYYKF